MHGQLTDRLTIRTAELHSDIYLNTHTSNDATSWLHKTTNNDNTLQIAYNNYSMIK